MAALPALVIGERVELHVWTTDDLDELLETIAESLEDLACWMPWARQLPTAREQQAVLERFIASFASDEEWPYAIREPSGRLLGGIGLHNRSGPGTLEIGYWVRSGRTGRGYASEATALLSTSAFAALAELERIEIHMDQANRASAGVARAAGYRLEAEVDRPILTSGHTGRGFVYVADRSRWRPR